MHSLPAYLQKLYNFPKLYLDKPICHFDDGNGRTGRMILNQQLINHGLLPITIHKNSDYRRAFKRYDKNGNISLMVHVVLDGEREAIQRLRDFQEKAAKNVFTP